jgi:hypothetical protein
MLKLMSRVLLARITPLTPPIVKRIMNLLDHIVTPLILILIPVILASQLNTLMPVGTAIIKVAEE